MEQVKSRVVCRHWRRGKCFKGDICGFSHAGQQNKSLTTTKKTNTSKTNTRVPACKNGPTCDWLGKGTCSYFQPTIGVQRPWVNKLGGQQEAARSSGGRQGGHQGGHGRDTRQGTQIHNNKQNNRNQYVQQQREQCKFNGRCERIPNCPFIHSLEDFPIFQGRRAPVVRRKQNQTRN